MKRYLIALFALLQCLSANPFVKYEYDGYNGHLLTIKDGYDWTIQHSYDLKNWEDLDIMIVLDMMVYKEDVEAETKTYIFWKAPVKREFFRLKINSNPTLDFISYSYESTLAAIENQTENNIFTNYNTPLDLNRNPNNFMNSLEGVTSLIVWNSRTNGKQLGGAAITPRHIICTKHAIYQPGDDVLFVTKDNEFVWRRITAVKSRPEEGDYAVCLLNSDLPSTIKPIELLPNDFYKYLDHSILDSWNSYWSEVPVVWANQNEKSSVGEIRAITFSKLIDPSPDAFSTYGYGKFQLHPYSTSIVEQKFVDWYIKPIAGDSGSIMMSVVGNKLVATGMTESAGNGSFFGQDRFHNDINRMIEELGSKGHNITELDMSGFFNYAE